MNTRPLNTDFSLQSLAVPSWDVLPCFAVRNLRASSIRPEMLQQDITITPPTLLELSKPYLNNLLLQCAQGPSSFAPRSPPNAAPWTFFTYRCPQGLFLFCKHFSQLPVRPTGEYPLLLPLAQAPHSLTGRTCHN